MECLIIYGEMEGVIMPGYYLGRLRHHRTRPEGTTTRPARSYCPWSSKARAVVPSAIGLRRLESRGTPADPKAAAPKPAAASSRPIYMLLVVGTTSLLLFALGINTLRTASAHPPSAKRHLHGMCIPIPGVLWPKLRTRVYSFLQPA